MLYITIANISSHSVQQYFPFGSFGESIQSQCSQPNLSLRHFPMLHDLFSHVFLQGVFVSLCYHFSSFKHLFVMQNISNVRLSLMNAKLTFKSWSHRRYWLKFHSQVISRLADFNWQTYFLAFVQVFVCMRLLLNPRKYSYDLKVCWSRKTSSRCVGITCLWERETSKFVKQESRQHVL